MDVEQILENLMRESKRYISENFSSIFIFLKSASEMGFCAQKNLSLLGS